MSKKPITEKRYTSLSEDRLIEAALRKVYIEVDPERRLWAWKHPGINDEYMAKQISEKFRVDPPFTASNVKIVRHECLGVQFKRNPHAMRKTAMQIPMDFDAPSATLKPAQVDWEYQLKLMAALDATNTKLAQLQSMMADIDDRVTALEEEVTKPSKPFDQINKTVEEMVNNALEDVANG